MQVEFHCTEDDTQWAGMSCSEDEPCPLYLELSAVEAVGNRIFAAGNIHSDSTTLYSILLSSEDAGKTWRESHERIRGCGLDHIQFADFENGWISGEFLNPLPRDPFLLITADGGKTWRQHSIFSESRIGAVQQFWFDSKKNGTLLIDRTQSGESARYELYESPNGGETWMIREASQSSIRIKMGLTAKRDSAWRIRPDAASQSFEIERQQEERWIKIAGFSVPIGFCKPEARKSEPPPEAAPESDEAPLPAPAPPLRRPSKPPSLKRPF